MFQCCFSLYELPANGGHTETGGVAWVETVAMGELQPGLNARFISLSHLLASAALAGLPIGGLRRQVCGKFFSGAISPFLV